MTANTLLGRGNHEPVNIADYETAINNAGQGRFQLQILFLAGLIDIATIFEAFSITYLLPSAECDLRMSSYGKTILNAAPFIGTLLGACFWGKMADSWGRRSAILIANSVDVIAAILSSLMQTFWPFVFFRFITGLTIMAAHPLCFPYLTEFHSPIYRSRAVLWLEIFAALGGILVPLVAWAIIPRPWLLGSAEIGFRYNSWRMFMAAAAIPALICAIATYFSPESPAYLMSKGKHDEALAVFRSIYSRNTGNSPDSYPVNRLEMNFTLEEKDEKEEKASTRSSVILMIKQISHLFRPPLLKNTIIGLTSLFSLQLGFFGFGMWFPELFNRFEEFQEKYPNLTASVCEVSNMMDEKPQWMVDWESGTNATIDCSEDTIQPQVFVKTLSIGITCMIVTFITGTFVERIGRKRVIIMAMLLTALCGAGSFFTKSAAQNLALSCFLQAFNAASYATLMSVIVDFYPASLRGLASTLILSISNIGSIVGNLLFGLLLDVDCAYPVFISAGVMGGCALLCFFLPNNKIAAMS
ncbi:synaptic vesicle glycoprotein 2B-like [Ischnura elegans]|uniref:synaptic vesicle glycoprotein 2B-like n=1 Tax=Ischnura elegans TaxID=197161 RepID=UPI001ED8B668|nr:synaptic vesicle glycoprotein 2B-like [Ischnura elegans]